MKKLPFTKEDYKTITLFILVGVSIFFAGMFTFPRPVEITSNFIKFLGVFPYIVLLFIFWLKLPVFVRCGALLGLIGLQVSPILHFYNEIFTYQPQNYLVNMSYHLTMITIYIVGLVWFFNWLKSPKRIKK